MSKKKSSRQNKKVGGMPSGILKNTARIERVLGIRASGASGSHSSNPNRARTRKAETDAAVKDASY